MREVRDRDVVGGKRHEKGGAGVGVKWREAAQGVTLRKCRRARSGGASPRIAAAACVAVTAGTVTPEVVAAVALNLGEGATGGVEEEGATQAKREKQEGWSEG